MQQLFGEPRSLVVTVNGERQELPESCHVAGLLVRLSLDSRKVAVERNEAIVPRSRYLQTVLQPGDSLEIVHFIGGG